jgi:hypothetical protein
MLRVNTSTPQQHSPPLPTAAHLPHPRATQLPRLSSSPERERKKEKRGRNRQIKTDHPLTYYYYHAHASSFHFSFPQMLEILCSFPLFFSPALTEMVFPSFHSPLIEGIIFLRGLFCLLLEVEFERKIQVQIRAMRMEWEYGYTAKNAILFCPSNFPTHDLPLSLFCCASAAMMKWIGLEASRRAFTSVARRRSV